MSMFDFIYDLGTHKSRVIDRYKSDGLIVDTCRVSDGKQPIETAVLYPEYDNGNWVIVEAYDTEEEAQKGHDNWVKRMTAAELPDSLTDCMNAGICELFDEPLVYERGK